MRGWTCNRDGFQLQLVDIEKASGDLHLILKCSYCGMTEVLHAGKQYRHGTNQMRRFIKGKIREILGEAEAEKYGANDDRGSE